MTREVLETLDAIKDAQSSQDSMLHAILEAHWQTGACSFDVFHALLAEVEIILSSKGDGAKELQGSLDKQMRTFFSRYAIRKEILKLLKEHKLQKNLYPCTLAVLGEFIDKERRLNTISHTSRIVTGELEILVVSIAKGINNQDEWLSSVRGDVASSVKILGEKIQGLRKENLQVELKFASELGHEDSVGWKFMQCFQMDVEAHASAVAKGQKIQEVIKAIGVDLKQSLDFFPKDIQYCINKEMYFKLYESNLNLYVFYQSPVS